VAWKHPRAAEYRRTFGHPCVGDTFSIDETWLSSQAPFRTDGSGPLPETLQDQEKEMIEAALAKSRGQVAGPRGAATALGIPRLDAGIEDQAIGHRETSIHFGALTRLRDHAWISCR
jgi:hypothetical protein